MNPEAIERIAKLANYYRARPTTVQDCNIVDSGIFTVLAVTNSKFRKIANLA